MNNNIENDKLQGLEANLNLAKDPHQTYIKLLKKLYDDPNLKFKLDTFSDTKFISFNRGKSFEKITNLQLTNLIAYIDSKGFKHTIIKNQLLDLIDYLANLNLFDEPSELIKNLIPTWDGIERIKNFYKDIWHLDNSPQNTADSYYLWTGITGRHLEFKKGCRIEIMPTWISDEGINKSTVIRELALKPEWYKPITFNGNESDISRKTKGGTFIEFSEIEGLDKKGMEFFKFWFSQTYDHYRPLYQNDFITVLRRWMMIATSNKIEILPYGINRRFNIKFFYKHANVDLLVKNLNQYYAEAVIKYLQNGVMWQETQAFSKEFNKQFQISSSIEEKLQEYLHTPIKYSDQYKTIKPIDKEYLTILEILTHLNIPIERQTQKLRNEVGSVLKEFGYIRKNKKINNSVINVWCK